jgi:hypothetical protein
MKWSFLLLSLCLSLSFFDARAQVNPQSGAAQFHLPIYSYSDAGNRLQLSVSLDYLDGNGLKVSEMAPAVGTGWSLSCGGLIQRIQHGEPDDQFMPNPPAFSTNMSLDAPYSGTFYPNGYMYNGPIGPNGAAQTPYYPSDDIDNGAVYSPYAINFVPVGYKNYKLPPQYLADRDQDIYVFTFNGRSGSFVIGANGTPVTLVDSKLKISFTTADMTASQIRTRINQFTITDEEGIQYVFKDMELNYVCDYTNLLPISQDHANLVGVVGQTLVADPTVPNNGSYVLVTTGVSNGWSIVDKWYLSQIINPLTGKQITFNYSTYNEDMSTDITAIQSTTTGHLNGANSSAFFHRYKVAAKRLSSVIMSDNSERLDFTYSSAPRVDLPHQNTLDKIQVSYSNNPVYSWQFGYGYMVGMDKAIKSPGDSYSQAESNWSRLCLLTAQRVGQTGFSEPPYQFSYYLNQNGGVVPPMFSIYQDPYGYYNNVQANSTPSTEGFVNSFYGITQFNSLVNNNFNYSKLIDNGYAQNGILQTITNPYGGTLTYSYEQNKTAAGYIGGVRVNQTTQYDGVSHTNDIIKNYAYLNPDETTSSGWGGENFVFSTISTATALGCSQKQVPSAIFKEVATSYLEEAILMHTITIASAELVASEVSDLLGQFEITFLIAALFGSSSTPPTQQATFNTYYLQSLTDNNPLPWGYARTEVTTQNGLDKNGNPVTAGKVVYTYSNPNSSTDNQPFLYPTMAVPYSNKPRCASWVYGLPETTTFYNNLGNPVEQTTNTYHFIVNTMTDNNFESKSWTAHGARYGCSQITSDATDTNVLQETYYPLTGHVELQSTTKTLYNALQQSTSTTTNFDYDANYQLKDQYSTNSKGETIKTIYYHPYDYPQATGGIGQMNLASSNVTSPVISTETYITKSDGTQYLTGATATNYQQTYNGDIKPAVTYTFQNPVPVASTALQPFNPANVVRDANYYQQVTSYSYDNNGNAAQIITGGNRITSGIFDYSGQLQVAVVKNASFNDIWYNSFEADGGKPGSTVNTTAITSSDARTGNQCFNLSDPSTATNGYFSFAGLNNSLNYIVSFWSKNGSACIAGLQNGSIVYNGCQGASGWKQGETVNGWTYYEVKVNNIDKISVSGTGLIDEFRIYPVGALMSTTTYAPLIGKTSECGPDNKVIYYQYDEMGRLQYIRDDQKNIIRMYQYNYKQ